MRKLWLIPLVAAAAVAVVASAASAPGGRVAVKDAAGDNKTAPDVTSLALHQEGKRVVYEFTVAGRSDKLNKGEYLVLFVDADNNPKTGGNDAGADYLIEFEQTGNGRLAVSKYDPATKKLTYDKSFTGSFRKLWGGLNGPKNVWRFYFTPSMFGITSKFGFYGRAESAGSGDAYTFDRVPNARRATFVLENA